MDEETLILQVEIEDLKVKDDAKSQSLKSRNGLALPFSSEIEDLKVKDEYMDYDDDNDIVEKNVPEQDGEKTPQNHHHKEEEAM